MVFHLTQIQRENTRIMKATTAIFTAYLKIFSNSAIIKENSFQYRKYATN
jgi:hypothetical protein